MRFLPVAAAIALAAISVSTSLSAQRADTAIDPRSMALLNRGKAAEAAGNLPGATDLIESALVVDPRNRGAFLELAVLAEKQQLPGKAIRLYREALLLEPNDVAALRGQGEAMVTKGALGPAKENLARIRTLCGKKACPEATALAATIAKGPPLAAIAPTKVPDKPDAAKE
ncbi:hypothetical protein [uncultured Sphingomonas sp.]|uniref:hypothetical protein n=1 Tax=uncultured Sphingomonas sp. TaxID=158754 RepID=UPI0035C9604D